MAVREDAKRVAETMLHANGRAVVLRVMQPAGVPPMETLLQPCLLKVKGEAAEMLVAASALEDVAGLPQELFSVPARVVASEVVWRVRGYTTMQYGETVVGWRVQLAR